jgi:hypothetical protein
MWTKFYCERKIETFFIAARARGIHLGCTAACRPIVQPWIPLPPPHTLILDVPASAARCFHVQTTRYILVAKGGTSWTRIVRYFRIPCTTYTLHVRIFYVPQICDMGPTALLPIRRKARAEDFFPPAVKNSDEFGRVRTRELWVLKASTLRLEHRSR